MATTGMIQREEEEWAEPCLLPTVSRIVEDGSAIRNAAGALLDPTAFRSATDHVLAAFAPQFRESITRFYLGKGAPLRALASADRLRELDIEIARTVVERAREWARIKSSVEARGGSTKAAAAEFAAALEGAGQLDT